MDWAWKNQEKTGCFALNVTLLSCDCKCYVVFHAVPWIGGISWSYVLFSFFITSGPVPRYDDESKVYIIKDGSNKYSQHMLIGGT